MLVCVLHFHSSRCKRERETERAARIMKGTCGIVLLLLSVFSLLVCVSSWGCKGSCSSARLAVVHRVGDCRATHDWKSRRHSQSSRSSVKPWSMRHNQRAVCMSGSLWASPSSSTSACPVEANSMIDDSTNRTKDRSTHVKTAISLSLWYLISSYYNIYNKKALNKVFLPWTVATIQMGAGMLFFIPLWLFKFRPNPFKNKEDIWLLAQSMAPVSLFATLSHISGVMSLGLGSVSFVQVVKAAEPLFTALISIVCLRDFLPFASYLAMIPVIVGVAIASVHELSFSWLCLTAGVLSNLFAGARAVTSKAQMMKHSLRTTDALVHNPEDIDREQQQERRLVLVRSLSASNFYSVLTILSFLMCIPLMLINEYKPLIAIIQKTVQGTLSVDERMGFGYALLSGVLYYVYNEMSFQVLAKMNPVSHALANTVKRVAVIGLSVLVFRTQLSFAGKVGSVMSILGALLYSLVGKKTKK